MNESTTIASCFHCKRCLDILSRETIGNVASLAYIPDDCEEYYGKK